MRRVLATIAAAAAATLSISPPAQASGGSYTFNGCTAYYQASTNGTNTAYALGQAWAMGSTCQGTRARLTYKRDSDGLNYVTTWAEDTTANPEFLAVRISQYPGTAVKVEYQVKASGAWSSVRTHYCVSSCG